MYNQIEIEYGQKAERFVLKAAGYYNGISSQWRRKDIALKCTKTEYPYRKVGRSVQINEIYLILSSRFGMFPIVLLWFLGRKWVTVAKNELQNLSKGNQPEKTDDIATTPSEGFLAVPAIPSVSGLSSDRTLFDEHQTPNSLTAESSSSEKGFDLHANSHKDLNSISTSDTSISKPSTSKGPSKFKAAIIRGSFNQRKRQIEKHEIITGNGLSFVPEPIVPITPIVGELSPSDDSLIGSSGSLSKEELAEDVILEDVTCLAESPPIIDLSIRSPSADSVEGSSGSLSKDEIVEDIARDDATWLTETRPTDLIIRSPSEDSLSKEELAEDVTREDVTRLTETRPIGYSIRSISADSLVESSDAANEELELEDRLDKVLFLLNEVRNSLKQLKEFVQILEETGERYLLEKEKMERQLEEQERLISEIKIRIEEHERRLEKINSIKN